MAAARQKVYSLALASVRRTVEANLSESIFSMILSFTSSSTFDKIAIVSLSVFTLVADVDGRPTLGTPLFGQIKVQSKYQAFSPVP